MDVCVDFFLCVCINMYLLFFRLPVLTDLILILNMQNSNGESLLSKWSPLLTTDSEGASLFCFYFRLIVFPSSNNE